MRARGQAGSRQGKTGVVRIVQFQTFRLSRLPCSVSTHVLRVYDVCESPSLCCDDTCVAIMGLRAGIPCPPSATHGAQQAPHAPTIPSPSPHLLVAPSPNLIGSNQVPRVYAHVCTHADPAHLYSAHAHAGACTRKTRPFLVWGLQACICMHIVRDQQRREKYWWSGRHLLSSRPLVLLPSLTLSL